MNEFELIDKILEPYHKDDDGNLNASDVSNAMKIFLTQP